jgi:hypothetical protein
MWWWSGDTSGIVTAMRPWLLSGLVTLTALSLSGSDCGDGFRCECTPCGAAITISAVDDNGDADSGDWTIEASLDGTQIETSQCNTENRGDLSSCGFGFEVGTYQVVMRSPRGEKSFAARFAGRAGQDCCNCIVGDTVVVVVP